MLPFACHPDGSALVCSLTVGTTCLQGCMQEGQLGLRRSSVVEVGEPSLLLGPLANIAKPGVSGEESKGASALQALLAA